MASVVDLQALLEAASGERIGRQADTSNHFLAMLDRAFGKVYAEPDIMETAAGRQLMMRESPIENTKPAGT